MTKGAKIAIEELKLQSVNLTANSIDDNGWKATTSDLIQRYTGKESAYYQEFLEWASKQPPIEDTNLRGLQYNRVDNLIYNVVQHIQRYGLYVPPKKPFQFNELSLTTLSLLGGGALAIFLGAYNLGAALTRRDVTIEQLKLEIKLDSFRRASSLVPKLAPTPAHDKPKKVNQTIVR